jgi:hypothetical protein
MALFSSSWLAAVNEKLKKIAIIIKCAFIRKLYWIMPFLKIIEIGSE